MVIYIGYSGYVHKLFGHTSKYYNAVRYLLFYILQTIVYRKCH